MLKRELLNEAITTLRDITGNDYRIAFDRTGTRAAIRRYIDTNDIFGTTCTDGKIPLSHAIDYVNSLISDFQKAEYDVH